MIDVACTIIVDALRLTIDEACAALPGGPACSLVVVQTDEKSTKDEPPALCRVDAQDAITMAFPLETDERPTLTVGFTITLQRSKIPALAAMDADVQHVRRAVLQCSRAIGRGLVQAFDRENPGLIELDGVCVYAPSEITINEPDTETDASIASGTVTAVFAVEDRYVLTRG